MCTENKQKHPLFASPHKCTSIFYDVFALLIGREGRKEKLLPYSFLYLPRHSTFWRKTVWGSRQKKGAFFSSFSCAQKKGEVSSFPPFLPRQTHALALKHTLHGFVVVDRRAEGGGITVLQPGRPTDLYCPSCFFLGLSSALPGLSCTQRKRACFSPAMFAFDEFFILYTYPGLVLFFEVD